MKEEYVTIQEAADFFGISTRTLRRWEDKGFLTAHRTFGNQRRYSKSQLQSLFTVPQPATPEIPTQTTVTPTVTAHSLHTSGTINATQSTAEKTIDETVVERKGFDTPTTHVVHGFAMPPLQKKEQPKFVMAFAGAAGILFFFVLTAVAFTYGDGLNQGRLGFNAWVGKDSGVATNNQNVLAAQDAIPNYVLKINAPTVFSKPVTFLDAFEIKNSLTVERESNLFGGIKTNNKDIDAGTGRVIASNVLYSLLAGSNITISGDPQNPTLSASGGVDSIQGQTGAVVFTEGTGIGLDGLEISNTGVLSLQGQSGALSFSQGAGITLNGLNITNSDPGSAQKIYGTFRVGSTDITAGSNTDTLTFAAGSGITLTPDNASKKITITSDSSGVLSGLTANGVLYATSATTAISTGAGTSGYILKSTGTSTPPEWVAPGTVLGFVNFDFVSSGTNTMADMVVGTGATLNYTGTGTINASSLQNATWVSPGAIGSTTANSGAFTTLTATTLNGLTVTANGSNTLTIATGKTVTLNNSIALSGTDGTTFIFPSASGTLVSRDSTDTLTNKTIAAGSNTITGLTNANLSGTAGITNANLANPSLTVTAGTGMSGGGAVSLGGSVTLNNAGVTSATGGSGITIDTSTGDITVTNSGVTSLAGTANQVSVSAATGAVTLSLPQNIHSGATPAFSGLTLSGLTNNGGILYTNGSGTVTQTTVGNPGECLTSSGGGAPGWAVCTASNYWQVNNGAISPFTDSLDLLIGGTATASAKFAFMNVTGAGTPTASISGASNNALSLNATGFLSTTNAQTLQLGASGTGNVILAPNGVTALTALSNGSIGIGTSFPQATVDVRGNSGTTPIASFSGQTTHAGLIVDQSGLGDIFTASKSGAAKFVITNAGNVGIGTATPRSLLDLGVDGSALTIGGPGEGGQVNFGSSNALNSVRYKDNEFGLFTTQVNGFRFYANADSDTSTPEFIIADNGSITFGASSYANCSALETVGNVLTCGTDDTGVTTNYWQLNNGAVSPFSNTADLLIGGTSTASAKFAVLNVTDGTPTASLSAGTTGAAYLTAAGILQTTANQTLSIGGNTTGNITLLPGNSSGSVGIGTATPVGTLHLWGTGAAGSNAVINFGDRGSLGNPYIRENGTGDSDILELGGSNGLLFATSTSGSYGVERMEIDASGNLVFNDNGTSVDFTIEGDTDTSLFFSDGSADRIGIGTTTPTAKFDVAGAASVSGSLTFRTGAGAIQTTANNTLTLGGNTTGDIVLNSDGNNRVGIGTTTPGAELEVNGESRLNFYTDSAAYGASIGGGINTAQWSGAIPYFLFNSNDALGYIFKNTAGAKDLFRLDGSGLAGLGTPVDTVLRGTLDLRAQSGTLSIASISGNTARAALFVENNGSGDLFVASSAGDAMFVVKNNGYVGIGITNPGHALAITSGGVIQMSGGVIQDYSDFNIKIDADNNSTSDNFNIFDGDGNRLLTIEEGSGNVGIGLDDPTDLLHLDGMLRFVNPTESDVSGNSKIFVGSQPETAADGSLNSTILNELAAYGGDVDPYNGLIFQTGGTSDGGGMKLTDDGLAIWGSGDEDLLRIYNEDDNVLLFVVDDAGNADIDGILQIDTNSDDNERLCHSGSDGAALSDIYIEDCTVAGEDFAEFALVNDVGAEPGDVVTTVGPDEAHPNLIRKTKTTNPYQMHSGVISTNPFIDVLGDEQYKGKSGAKPIALAGRIPVKVSTENGSIAVGDPLAASSIPGVAMKANRASYVIGFAQEAYDGSVRVSNQVLDQERIYNSDLDDRKAYNSNPVSWPIGVGKIIAEYKPTWFDPAAVLNENGNIVFNGESLNPAKLSEVYTAANSATDLDAFDPTVFNERVATTSALSSLSQKTSSLSDMLDGLTGRVSALESNASSAAFMTAVPGSFTASSAAELDLDAIDVTDVTVSNTLAVVGRTTLSDVGITGKLNIGLLSIEGLDKEGTAAVNTSAGPLRLQSTGLNGIDILNGMITIDKSGDLKTKGSVTTKKVNIDTSDVAGASLGEAVLESGLTKVVVTTKALTEKSKIFVQAQDVPITTAVKKIAEDKFEIRVRSSETTDVKLNWWIVN